MNYQLAQEVQCQDLLLHIIFVKQSKKLESVLEEQFLQHLQIWLVKNMKNQFNLRKGTPEDLINQIYISYNQNQIISNNQIGFYKFERTRLEKSSLEVKIIDTAKDYTDLILICYTFFHLDQIEYMMMLDFMQNIFKHFFQVVQKNLYQILYI
ncbi:unnamed protein product [Paramecium sonneborni]|uniref:Uncharacterized protein n=1 Tax=Paramecium sonneborni TaxID=65129 RepID=A0A8S1RRZ6_9CILI|nr:unnamed protein product [Paramecium sonneborni]